MGINDFLILSNKTFLIENDFKHVFNYWYTLCE